MASPNTAIPNGLDKKYITALTIFAINNIPDADETTLKKFLELMNTTGSFGSISEEHLIVSIQPTSSPKSKKLE